MRVAPQVTLTSERYCDVGRTTPMRLVRRARIVLLAAEGNRNIEIATVLGVDRSIVGRWRRRFVAKGLPGIERDAPHGERKPTKRNQLALLIIRKTTKETPSNATHWSTNSLAKVLGTSRSTVSRVWRAIGLKPHLSRTFKVGNDPHFVEKLIDVVGLYLDPLEHALVLCADEGRVESLRV